MITFRNDGVLSPVSITTFGVSVKENINPIGFFGTGLKYAIAVLLRNQQKITILTGLDTLTFSIQPTEVRGKSFDLICMSTNSQAPVPMGFTTELGKTWELWMAFRELACNCMDEGGKALWKLSSPLPDADTTTVCVSGDDFEQVFQRRQDFLLSSSPLHTLEGICELRRPKNSAGNEGIFYRNVLVEALRHPSLFQYNILGRQELTEDRTLKNFWQVPYKISEAFIKCENRELLRKVLTAPKGTFEHDELDYRSQSEAPSKVFLEVVGELCESHAMTCNLSAVKVYESYNKKAFSPKEISLTAVQTKMLERAMLFCTKIGFPIASSHYTIKFVQSLGGDTIGLAIQETDTVFISESVFINGGTKLLASTLIEEYLHLEKGWADMSRELQTFLFDKVVSIGEELQGEPL